MAGIYIHIPFCKQICSYCDFYRTDNLDLKRKYISVLKLEINQRKNYLAKSKIKTIYFGGGTPSVLSSNEINTIINELENNFNISTNAEITLELNADDINQEYLNNLLKTKINRLSIGIQSFIDKHLVMLNRRHTAQQAIDSIELCKNAGYKNISIDIIYGINRLTESQIHKQIDIINDLDIQHISAYHLTIEKKTVLYKRIKKGELFKINENDSIFQHKLLFDNLKNMGFVNYEISNWAKQNYISKHNSNYWKQKKYIGFGPSAHSYNKKYRQWNISNLKMYIEKVVQEKGYFSKEYLSKKMKYNEYIMTGLRTIWGVDKNYILDNFGNKYFEYFMKNINKYIISNQITQTNSKIIISNNALLISDKIIEDCFIL